ncbi:MAG: hypothetical protein ACFFCP_04585 [Promethearchaeota archaeon]
MYTVISSKSHDVGGLMAIPATARVMHIKPTIRKDQERGIDIKTT